MQFRQGDLANKYIHFIVRDPVTGIVLGRGIYSTTRQRVIEQENKELLERQEAYLEANSTSLFKMKEPKHSH